MIALAFVVFAGCCGANETLLISPEQLAALDDAYAVDTRSAEDYARGHVPGAVRVDVDAFSETRDGVRGLLRPVDQLVPLLEAAGLHPDKHVVIYGSANGVEGLRPATRLFWILEYLGFPKVSILDGGFEAWAAAGREVSTDPVQPEPVKLPPLEPREELRATTDEVAVAAEDPSVEVIDVRSPEEYKGEKKSQSVARAGHVPGAENAPVSELLDPRGRFKSVQEIDKIIARSGVRPDAEAIAYCNTGRQASVGYFALRLLGRDNVALYDGSMSAWTSDRERDVATGSQDDSKQSDKGEEAPAPGAEDNR